MRKVSLLICAFFIIFLYSCRMNDGLTVYSYDYHITEKLYESEFDPSNPIYWDVENQYYGCSCMLEDKNGEIWISNKGKDNRQWLLPLKNGYIIGVNLGIHDGWVRYYQTESGVTNTPHIDIIMQNCICCFETQPREWIVLTGNYLAGDNSPKGTLLLCKDDENIPKVNELCTFDDYPEFAVKLDNGLYIIITENNVISFNPDDATKKVILESKEISEGRTILSCLDINSYVQRDSMIYFGTNMGIYAIDMLNCTEHCYSLDYSRISN